MKEEEEKKISSDISTVFVPISFWKGFLFSSLRDITLARADVPV